MDSVPFSARASGFSHHLLSFSVRRVPPRFSIPPTDNEIMPGGSVNITCVAVGSPMPYVKWMLGAEDLTPEDDMPIGRNVLELTDVRQSANYTCVAMSTLGVIEAVAQITVKGKAVHLHNQRQSSELSSSHSTNIHKGYSRTQFG